MQRLNLARSTAGIVAVAAMGVATVVSATTGSAALTIQPSQAYCVGTTYTVTLPAADAAQLVAATQGYNQLLFEWVPAAGGNATEIARAPYVAGQDATIRWTPTIAVQTRLEATSSAGPGHDGGVAELLTVDVVQNAPAGASCTSSSTSATGSAGWLPNSLSS
ncbi:Ig-like domain-containing protein [Nocardia concava]|uniref:Ig-like domain-containing protein n=1 Tax=Nocardia concava TaxID=257281 RepID=UPI000592740C|nr:Ig-like domain-containing protein [Nocardia concava]